MKFESQHTSLRRMLTNQLTDLGTHVASEE